MTVDESATCLPADVQLRRIEFWQGLGGAVLPRGSGILVEDDNSPSSEAKIARLSKFTSLVQSDALLKTSPSFIWPYVKRPLFHTLTANS